MRLTELRLLMQGRIGRVFLATGEMPLIGPKWLVDLYGRLRSLGMLGNVGPSPEREHVIRRARGLS